MGFFDPKPIGAFIEYTVKPIIEDLNNLLDRCKEQNIDVVRAIVEAKKVFVLNSILGFI